MCGASFPGEPSFDAEFEVGFNANEDSTPHGLLATGMRAVNAIPWVWLSPTRNRRRAPPSEHAGIWSATTEARRDPDLLTRRSGLALPRQGGHDPLIVLFGP